MIKEDDMIEKRCEKLHLLIENSGLMDVFDSKWIDKNKYGKHPICLTCKYRSEKDARKLLVHLEKMLAKVKVILLDKDPFGKQKYNKIISMLRDKEAFEACVAELDWLVYLDSRCNNITYEPISSGKTFDIEAKLFQRNIAFEILSIQDSDDDKDYDFYRSEMERYVGSVPSSFMISVTINKKINHDEFYRLRKILVQELKKNEMKNNKKSFVLFYFEEEGFKKWEDYDEMNPPSDIFHNPEKYPLLGKGNEASFKFAFVVRNRKYSKTPMLMGKQINSEHERIKGILKDKISQLPKDTPAVIVANLESPFTDNFDLLNALFGDYGLKLYIEKTTGRVMKEVEFRSANGLFDISSRISAVIFYRRANDMKISSSIYINPNAKLPLTQEEVDILKS